MTRSEFLNALYRKLPGMSREEAEQYLTYYAEMLADRMEEGMTEEEAVGSMEDVDAIAQRILQDRSAEAAAQPPRAPEVPAREASPEGTPDAFSGGAEPAPREKRRRPRWALPAALAGAFLLLCFLSPGPIIQINNEGVKIGSFYCGPDGVCLGGLLTIDNDGIRLGGARSGDAASVDAVDSVTTVWEENDIPADHIQWAERVDGAYLESGVYKVSAQGVTKIDIKWTAGQVYLRPGDGENIEFLEASDQRLDSKSCLSYQIEDGKLTIRYIAGLRTDAAKDLTVFLPESLKGTLEELDVETASAEVLLEDVRVEKLDVETVSGTCSLMDGACGEADLSTTSGDIFVDGWESRSWDVETVSGYVVLSPTIFPQELDMETTSGDIDLFLPASDSFALKWKTVSGQLDSSYDDLAFDGKVYRHGPGGPVFSVETVSGNLHIY